MQDTGHHTGRWGAEATEPALPGRRLSELVEDAPHGPARALGDFAMTCLVRDRSYRAALTELDQLGTALRSRPLVDQACGIVMHVLGCDADAAFGVLRRISQGSNRKLSDVAAGVVERRGGGLAPGLA